MLVKIDGPINIVQDVIVTLKIREGVVFTPIRGTGEDGTHQGRRIQALQL